MKKGFNQIYQFKITTESYKPKNIIKRKIDRNDPCPCDSGLKYKKCCMNK
jgi:uncharacterized protein YecA (UPF0149 family)